MLVRNRTKIPFKVCVGAKKIILEPNTVTYVEDGLVTEKRLRDIYGHRIDIIKEDGTSTTPLKIKVQPEVKLAERKENLTEKTLESILSEVITDLETEEEPEKEMSEQELQEATREETNAQEIQTSEETTTEETTPQKSVDEEITTENNEIPLSVSLSSSTDNKVDIPEKFTNILDLTEDELVSVGYSILSKYYMLSSVA